MLNAVIRNWPQKYSLVRSPKFIYIALAAVVIYLVATPLGLLLLSTVKATGDMLPIEKTPFTLANYVSAFSDPNTYALFGNTFLFTVGSLAIGTPIALFFAWLIERTNIPYRNLIYSSMLIPMAIPGMLVAMGWILLLSPRIGFFNLIIREILGLVGEGPFNIYTIPGMFFVEGLRIVPTFFLMMSGYFRSLDPALEDASAVAGKGMTATFRYITFPLLRPGITSTLIYFTILIIEAVEIPLVIGATAGINVFSTEIYWAAQPLVGLPNYGMASTYSMVIVVIAIILVYFFSKVTKRAEKYATITGKGYRPRPIELKKWKYPALAIVAAYLVLAVIFPFLILLWGSLLPFYSPPSLKLISEISLDNYRAIYHYPGVIQAFINTGILGTVTATATMFISSIISWFVVRGKFRGRQILDTITFLPQAIPSIVIGLGVMMVYLILPIPIYGTIWIIAIALTTRYLAFGSRTMNAAHFQIHRELEEASFTSGVSWIGTFKRIVLPLLAPSLLNGWLWVFIHAYRELSITLMLFSSKSVVLSTLIFLSWDDGRLPETCVLAVVLMVVLFVIAFGGRMFMLKIFQTYEWGDRRA